ncbi:MAG TPA: Gfo/Idh/MocA family oxidoreductase [Phycisphaerales bacterium]|nr:Gfo/Idh/MocA family oxidoreductase [Phycisphaerales bacterium]
MPARQSPAKNATRAGTAKSRQRPIRFALVGAGHIAQNAVLPGFTNARPGCELTAIVSGDARKRRALGKQYRVPHTLGYEDFDAACRADLFDAVYIALPNSMHCEYTIRAAEAGIHVLCEKPMAVTSSECRRMINACREHDVRLMVAYRLHFNKANMEAVRIAGSGQIGDPRIFNSVFSMQVKPENIRIQPGEGGGPLYDIGIYCINAARYLFRDEPIEITALNVLGEDDRFDDCDEASGAIMRFPGGRLATFVCSFGAADAGYYDLVGTRGSLCVDPAYEYQGKLKHFLTIGDRTREREFAKSDQFGPELTYFSQCIRTGRDPEPGGREGLLDIRIIEAIDESARTGRSITLERIGEEPKPDARQVMHYRPVRPRRKVHVAAPHRS